MKLNVNQAKDSSGGDGGASESKSGSGASSSSSKQQRAAVLQTPSPPPNWMKTRLATCTTATRSGLGQGQHAPEDKYLKMLVVLRMNRKFMEDMREHLREMSSKCFPSSRPSKRRLGSAFVIFAVFKRIWRRFVPCMLCPGKQLQLQHINK